LAYFEQTAQSYLELLENNDENDTSSTITYSKEEIQEKLANASQRIHYLVEIKQQIKKTESYL
ncbi:MAG: hypothetical protein K0Q53_1919, partial [Massilibacillus sp.]|nr:hypothetical protein [Massilibacillus sp.]